MWQYAIRRVFLSVPTVLIVFTLVFVLVRVAPGDPAIAALGESAPEEVLNAFREKMGLNDPLYVQYWRSLSGLIRGDLGRSMVSRYPINLRIKRVLGFTCELVFTGVLLGSCIGIPVGVVSALYRNRSIDLFGRVISLIGVALPSFYSSILLLFVFSVYFRILPAIGSSADAGFLDRLRHLLLPGVSLSLTQASYMTRLTRSTMLNVLNKDYILTARAKGLKEWIIIFKHALRNTLVPVTSFIGMYTIVLLGGCVLVEVVFARPGLGSLMVHAMNQRDYTTLQSAMMVFSFLAVGLNLLTDLTYAFLDPRIKYD